MHVNLCWLLVNLSSRPTRPLNWHKNFHSRLRPSLWWIVIARTNRDISQNESNKSQNYENSNFHGRSFRFCLLLICINAQRAKSQRCFVFHTCFLSAPHVRNFSGIESFLFFWRGKSTDSHESVHSTWLDENIFAPKNIVNMKTQRTAILLLYCGHEIISLRMLKIWIRRREVCASLPWTFVRVQVYLWLTRIRKHRNRCITA